eukprot:UN32524
MAVCEERQDWFITGGTDKHIKLWDRRSKHDSAHIVDVGTHNDWIMDLKFNRNGTYIYSCSWDGSISQWDTRKLKKSMAKIVGKHMAMK